MTTDFNNYADFIKVDETLGLVFGYAIVCKNKGQDYFDHHNDHIPEDAMLEAALEFMKSERIAGDMHRKEGGKVVQDGNIVFAFPLTTEIAKAFNITVEKTGLLIAMKPDNPETLKKFQDGTYKGFSIGGKRIKDEEVA